MESSAISYPNLDDPSDLMRFVPKVHFDLIPIKDLVSNQNYQRNLSRSHIEKTSDDFDIYQINPVKVSRRNGINYVFNGQHTIEIVAKVSHSRMTPVWCMIYDHMDYTTEAEIFANQQKNVKPLTPFEIFNAHIEAGDEEQLMIQSLVESYGLVIKNARNPGCICAIAALESINREFGFHTLDRALRLCVGTWEGDPLSLTSNMLRGVAKLIDVYGDRLRDDIFKEKVGNTSPKDIGRTAKERRGGYMGFSETILLKYNYRMQKPLPMGDLYMKKAKRKKDPEQLELCSLEKVE